jgi:hypothetical protein
MPSTIPPAAGARLPTVKLVFPLVLVVMFVAAPVERT